MIEVDSTSEKKEKISCKDLLIAVIAPDFRS